MPITEIMLVKDAKNIIRALADGLDPASLRPLEDSNVLQRPNVIRALFTAIEALEAIEAPPRWLKDSGQGVQRLSVARMPDKRTTAHLARAEELSKYKSQPASHALSSAGAKWGRDQDLALVQAFKEKKSIEEIANMHGRTAGAIASRLVRLGLIKNKAEVQFMCLSAGDAELARPTD
jgi:hypothetical protein